jgi:hypothetical protein
MFPFAGAGPVRLVMAIELARYGVAVPIIDKPPQGTDKSKALVIWSRSLGGLPTPYSYGLMIPQSDTERVLDKFLNSLGVKVERTVELSQLTTSKVVSTLRHADGTEEIAVPRG